MNELARHIEFLLRRHDCVVIPGLGALLCNYEAAHFEEDCDASASAACVMAPPARYVAFNGLIQDNDGLLGASVARREGVAYEAAMAIVGRWVDSLLRELDRTGRAGLGRIGCFVRNASGSVCLEASPLPGINGPLAGLRSLELYTLDAKAAVRAKEQEALERRAVERGEAVAAEVERKRSWRAYATGVVASLAVLITAAMFLISPIRIDRNAQMASLVPTSQPKDLPVHADDLAAAADIETLEAAVPVDAAITIGAPGADGRMPAAMRDNGKAVAAASSSGLRFSENDPFCVIVASFPSEKQAESYVASARGKRLGIIAGDGRYRVYAATGRDRRQAESQKSAAGEGAWVCRR